MASKTIKKSRKRSKAHIPIYKYQELSDEKGDVNCVSVIRQKFFKLVLIEIKCEKRCLWRLKYNTNIKNITQIYNIRYLEPSDHYMKLVGSDKNSYVKVGLCIVTQMVYSKYKLD